MLSLFNCQFWPQRDSCPCWFSHAPLRDIYHRLPPPHAHTHRCDLSPHIMNTFIGNQNYYSWKVVNNSGGGRWESAVHHLSPLARWDGWWWMPPFISCQQQQPPAAAPFTSCTFLNLKWVGSERADHCQIPAWQKHVICAGLSLILKSYQIKLTAERKCNWKAQRESEWKKEGALCSTQSQKTESTDVDRNKQISSWETKEWEILFRR